MTIKNETSSSGNSVSTSKDEPMRKIIVRRLPPTLKKEEFLEIISPLPDYDYFYYCKADMSLGPYAFCRAYFSFTNSEDVFIFKEKFDNYVFVDAKSNEYPALVEYAPYQKRPKNKAISEKKDSKCGTIEQDTEYIKFVENMDKPEGEQLPSCELILEQIEQKEKEMMNGGIKQSTPLLEYLKKRNDDRKALREKEKEIRRRRDDERRKRRDEDIQRRKEDDEKRKVSSAQQTSKPVTTVNKDGEVTAPNIRVVPKPPNLSKNDSNKNRYSGSGSSSTKNYSNGYSSSRNAAKSAPVQQKQSSNEKRSKEDVSQKIASSNQSSIKSNENLHNESKKSQSKAEWDKKDYDNKKEKPKRPAMEIYNPAERAAMRRQQQAQKGDSQKDA